MTSAQTLTLFYTKVEPPLSLRIEKNYKNVTLVPVCVQYFSRLTMEQN